MSDVTESVDVNVPASTAYAQWAKFETFPWFMAGVESVSKIDDTHTHWVTEVGGIRREFDAEITEQHPDERIAWRSTAGEVRHAGVVTFEPLADQRTRVTVHLDWEPNGFAEKAGSALGMDERQVKANAARFKRFVEELDAAVGVDIGRQPVTGPGDVVEVLLNQHTDILEAFARLQSAGGDDREPLFARLVERIQGHETGEQQVVHPVTRQQAGGEDIAAERLEEEQEVARAIAELENIGVDHPDFGRTLRAFHDTVLSHAAREEREEFPVLRRLPADERRRMADELRILQVTLPY